MGITGAGLLDSNDVAGGWITREMIVFSLAALFFLFSLKIALQWEKDIVLRLGKFYKRAGPGMFWILPLVDTVANWIDHREMVTPFNAKKTLTKDTM